MLPDEEILLLKHKVWRKKNQQVKCICCELTLQPAKVKVVVKIFTARTQYESSYFFLLQIAQPSVVVLRAILGSIFDHAFLQVEQINIFI